MMQIMQIYYEEAQGGRKFWPEWSSNYLKTDAHPDFWLAFETSTIFPKFCMEIKEKW